MNCNVFRTSNILGHSRTNLTTRTRKWRPQLISILQWSGSIKELIAPAEIARRVLSWRCNRLERWSLLAQSHVSILNVKRGDWNWSLSLYHWVFQVGNIARTSDLRPVYWDRPWTMDTVDESPFLIPKKPQVRSHAIVSPYLRLKSAGPSLELHSVGIR